MAEHDAKSPRDYVLDQIIFQDNYFHEYPQSDPSEELVARFEAALDDRTHFNYYTEENLYGSFEQIHQAAYASGEVASKENVPASRIVADIAQQILSTLQVRQGKVENPQLFLQLRNVGFLTGTGITMEMLDAGLSIRFSANSVDALHFIQANEGVIKDWLLRRLDKLNDINLSCGMDGSSDSFAGSEQGTRNPYQSDEETSS